MATTRFMRDLEIDLVPDRNVAAVDLFDPKHARKVLAAYGRAYGALPARDRRSDAGQRAFLDQAVAGLAQDGKVVPVRLALFAEMVKGKPWTPATLREVGGMDGVGVQVPRGDVQLGPVLAQAPLSPEGRPGRLEVAASRDQRRHQGADAVDRRAAGHLGLRRPAGDFADLIRVLDSDLRLITPVDPEGSIDERCARRPPPASEATS